MSAKQWFGGEEIILTTATKIDKFAASEVEAETKELREQIKAWEKVRNEWIETANLTKERAIASEREREEYRGKLTALNIMLTATQWGAAYGSVCEDYPELLKLVTDYGNRVNGEYKRVAGELADNVDEYLRASSFSASVTAKRRVESALTNFRKLEGKK